MIAFASRRAIDRSYGESGGERRVDPEHLGEADLVAGEASSTAQTIPPNLFRIPRPIDTLISNCLEEGGLQGQCKDVHYSPFDGEGFDCGDDLSSEPIPLSLRRNGDRRHLGHGWRVLLQGTAGSNPSSFVDRDEKVVDGKRHLLRRPPQHQVLGREDVIQPRDLRRLALVRGANEQSLMARSRHSTCSSTSMPRASSSRVATSGGRRRTVHSPAVHVSNPSSRAASTTWEALPMMSIPHM